MAKTSRDISRWRRRRRATETDVAVETSRGSSSDRPDTRVHAKKGDSEFHLGDKRIGNLLNARKDRPMHELTRPRFVNSPLLVNTKGSSSESRITAGMRYN